MPTNLTKKYNSLLELLYGTRRENIQSLRRVFNRDFSENLPILFKSVEVAPVPSDGNDKMEVLFSHLTTTVTDDKTKKREFEGIRAIRLHWIRYHLEQPINCLC